MTSKITFSNIKYVAVKDAADIKKIERKEGRLNARSIVNRFSPNMMIDVLLLGKCVTIVPDCDITFNEADIKKRESFLELTENEVKKGKLPVHTSFFKQVMEGDTIIIILHIR